LVDLATVFVVVVGFVTGGGVAVVVAELDVVVVGVDPLDSARACDAFDAVVVVLAPFFVDFFVEEVLAEVCVEDVFVLVVATSEGSNVLEPVVVTGAPAAGVVAAGVLEPQPATATATASAAITLGVRGHRKAYVLRMSAILASDERRVIDSVPHELFIGGSWQEGERGTFGVEDPST
jgi:hypothetical protein